MVVRNGEQFILPFSDPSFPVGCLALWAMSVATGIIADSLFRTVTAFGYMSTQCLCSAQGKCPKGFSYLYCRLVFSFKPRSMKTDNICYFVLRLQDLSQDKAYQKDYVVGFG